MIRTQRRLRCTSRRSYTLIELVIVLVIIGLVAAIAQPRLSSSLRTTNVRDAANRLALDLFYAQSEAVQRAEAITVEVDTDHATYQLLDADAVVLTMQDASKSPYRVDLGGSYDVKLVNTSVDKSNKVRFDAFGAPHADWQLSVQAGTTQARITVLAADASITVSPPESTSSIAKETAPPAAEK